MKWVVEGSPNGRDGRIVTEYGDKLTRYMNYRTARKIANEHNRAVDYLISHIPKEQKNENQKRTD